MQKTTTFLMFVGQRDTEEEIDTLYEQLSQSGSVLIELHKYPFSEKFGWVEDRFGVSWQLNLASK